jgi:hypothetical protein
MSVRSEGGDAVPFTAVPLLGGGDLRQAGRYRQASRQSNAYRPLYEKSLRAGEVKQALEAFKAHQDSYVAQVVSSGLMHYETAKEHGSDRDTQLEIVTSALDTRRSRR